MLFPGSPVWNLIFHGTFGWGDVSQIKGKDDMIDTMEDVNEKRIQHQRKQWEHMKIEHARKKLQIVWEKHNLHTMNPGLKEYKMSASHYLELKDAFDKYMKLFYDSHGKTYNPKGTIVFNGPNGPIKIVSR